jgi:uncharacterized tellurite resistance protein B-like protein
MIEEPKKPRIEGDELIIETQSATEVYDAKYLVAALLVYVAKGDGTISGAETAAMIELVNEHFGLQSAESLALLTNAMEDIAVNPDFENLLKDLSPLLNEAEKEEVALMMLKVVAADGRRDTEEMAKVRTAAELIGIQPDRLHRAYDRYFEETQA